MSLALNYVIKTLYKIIFIIRVVLCSKSHLITKQNRVEESLEKGGKGGQTGDKKRKKGDIRRQPRNFPIDSLLEGIFIGSSWLLISGLRTFLFNGTFLPV